MVNNVARGTMMYKFARSVKRLPSSFIGMVKTAKQNQIMLKFYSQFIRQGDLCFDIGANVGNRTQIFLKLGAAVIAVEPQDFCAKYLTEKFRKENRVVVVQKALGSKEGEGELLICSSHQMSSMSKDWINAVQTAERFPLMKWENTMRIPVTTIERLIEVYGKPTFCKIDVEGFEFEVLKGLTKKIKFISFEFTPEFISVAIDSINHLAAIGDYCFNFSSKESMRLDLTNWINHADMCHILETLSDKTIFGDIYAKLAG